MNVTATGIAIALAVVIAFGLLVVGPGMFRPETVTENIFTPTDTSMNPAETPARPLPEAIPTQLTIEEEVVGEGAEAKAGDVVHVRYLGMLPDGTVFDATVRHNNEPIMFTLGAGQVISGWDKGLVGMKEGGKRRIIIPPQEGYGDRAIGSIPANSTLIFDVELVKVGQ